MGWATFGRLFSQTHLVALIVVLPKLTFVDSIREIKPFAV
jgi:hypothetical protein